MDKTIRSAIPRETAVPGVSDLILALMGGTPPEYFTGPTLAAAMPVTITTCPQGIWRIILNMGAYSTAVTSRMAWGVNRNGTTYNLIIGTTTTITPNVPIILRPGDQLILTDLIAVAGATIYWGVSYTDIPLHPFESVRGVNKPGPRG